jgi:solute carrier family 25 S-adenosylmethionine transporter 26
MMVKSTATLLASLGLMLGGPDLACAGSEFKSAEYLFKPVSEQYRDIADEVTTYATIVATPSNQKVLQVPQSTQSSRWELARQKRTVAVKKMADQGIVKLDTDDDGNQVLSVPWMPNQKLQYKSLSLKQKLLGEVFAGAVGEFAKDVLLHPIDTLKSRKQAGIDTEDNEGKEGETSGGGGDGKSGDVSPLKKLRDLYAGFPAVASSSLPQGGVFFLCKKGGIEIIKAISPAFATSIVGQALPVVPGSIGYWGVRTPSEIVKLKVQLGQSPTVKDAFVDVKTQVREKGVLDLWKFYPALLSLDIPYAILNFGLYSVFNDQIIAAGVEPNFYTRLVSGAACGMIAAAITCPIDVAKTRIISRAKGKGKKNDEVVERTVGEEMVMAAVSSNLTEADCGYGVGEGDDYIQEPRVDDALMESSIKKNASSVPSDDDDFVDQNVLKEMVTIFKEEGVAALFTGLPERTIYVGLSNGIRLAAYSTSRMDLMMRNLDSL